MSHVENLESRLHLSAGGIDNSFGTGGQITTPIGNRPVAYSGITVLPGGKFIVAGGTTDRTNDSASMMVRYMADGSVDRRFGAGGRVPLRIDGRAVVVDAVAAAPSGAILALETAAGGKEFLVRYSANGSRNTHFGAAGKVAMPAGVNAAKITFDSSGNILLGAYYSPPRPGGEVAVDGTDSLALLRFSAAGQRDKAFGVAGVVITQFDITTWTPNIEPLADGKIMAIAQSGPPLDSGSIVRFNADGTLDTSYNQTGISPIAPPPDPQSGTFILNPVQNIAAQFQPDGSVVIADSDGQKDPVTVTRIAADGTDDTAFGNQDLTSLPFTNAPIAIAVQPDGDILIVANTFRNLVGQNEYDNVGIARLTSNGALDPTFGNQGIVVNDNSPAIGVGSAAIDGSRLLVEPQAIPPTKLLVAAYSI